jgi:nucleotide-binding universal stress UspA family protein
MNYEPKNADMSHLRVLIGLAFTDADGPAFDQATRIARQAGHSDLHLIHVFDKAPSPDRARDLVDHLRLYVNEKAMEVSGAKVLSVGIHLRAGKPAREIAALALDIGADLIVIGAHKHPDMKSWLVGSVAEHLVATAPCPVLIASPKQKDVHLAPTVEPACADCLRTRASSHGAGWWCERHSQHAKHAHSFSYQRELPLATHDAEIIPTGIAF